jgi:hypothetical protein
VDKLVVDNKNLWEVVDVQIEEGFKASYKITILKKHLKMRVGSVPRVPHNSIT